MTLANQLPSWKAGKEITAARLNEIQKSILSVFQAGPGISLNITGDKIE